MARVSAISAAALLLLCNTAIASIVATTAAGLRQQRHQRLGNSASQEPTTSDEPIVQQLLPDGMTPENATDKACLPGQALNFSNLRYSNLGGQGPDSSALTGYFYVNDVMPGSGKAVDLRISNLTKYLANQSVMNTVVDAMIRINVDADSSVRLVWEFLDGETLDKIPIGPVAFTILDIDEAAGADSEESVTIVDAWTLVAPPAIAPGTMVTMSDAGDVVTSAVKGTPKDNPTDSRDLTAVQLRKAAAVVFGEVSSFQLILTVEGGKSGRNFFFGGQSNLLCASGDTPEAALLTTGARRAGRPSLRASPSK